MLFRKKTIQLNEKFGLFFSKVNSLIFLKGIFGFLVLKLPSYYFFVNVDNFLSFIFLSKFYFSSFYRHFIYMYTDLFKLNFVRLRLKGLGYRIKKITNSLYRFFFNFTNFLYFHVPSNFLVYVKRKRILLLTHQLSDLKKVLAHLLLLKKLSAYRTRGLVYPRKIIYLKIGKKKL